MPYIVYNYAPEGETVERNYEEFDTLDEARAEALARVKAFARVDYEDRWEGDEPNEAWVSVEAYHESDKLGCGGVQISKISK